MLAFLVVVKSMAAMLAHCTLQLLRLCIIGIVFPKPITMIGKHTVWKYGLIAWLVARLGAVPSDRDKYSSTAYEATVKIMRRGVPAVFFAEGRRGSGPIIESIFPGAARATIELGVPLIPVGIGGVEHILPPGKKWPRRGRVVVVIGDPITLWDQTYFAIPVEEEHLVKHLHYALQQVFDQAEALAAH